VIAIHIMDSCKSATFVNLNEQHLRPQPLVTLDYDFYLICCGRRRFAET